MELQGKVALITGGARGLGAAIAEEMARLGASVAVVDLGEAGDVVARPLHPCLRRVMHRRSPIRSTRLGALSAGLALVSTNAEACSVCVGWSGEQGANAGYYWSALLLTVLPFLVVAVFGVWMRHTVRRARGARPGVAGRSPGSFPKGDAPRSIPGWR